MSYSASGILYFKSHINEDDLNDISFFIMQEAAKRRLGISLGANILPWTMKKYIDSGLTAGFDVSYMIFDISESAYYSNCDKLFEPMYFDMSVKPPKVLGIRLEDSRLPELQDFFAEILGNRYISYVRFDIEMSYALPENFVEYTIKAKDLCDSINEELKKQNTNSIAIRLLIHS